MAHELAHLADFVASGRYPRPFLVEGMAEFLRRSYPFALSPDDTIVGTAVDQVGPAACDDSWSIESIFAGVAWFDEYEAHRFRNYAVAALFTEVVAERMGLEQYREQFYGPASFGVTTDASALLKRLTGYTLKSVEHEMRMRVEQIYPCGSR